MIENNSCEEIIMGSFQYNLNAWKPLCAKECPELTSDVPRVEENHKNHTQELFYLLATEGKNPICTEVCWEQE